MTLNIHLIIAVKQLIEAGGMKTRFEGPDEVTTYEIEGVRFPTHLVAPSTIEAMKTWQARSDDVFILSYAKAGRIKHSNPIPG